MIDINKAKEKYNSTPIPQELQSVVETAIARGTKKQPIKLSFMRVASVAVCAVVCLAIGVNYFFGLQRNIPDETAVTADMAEAFVAEETSNQKKERVIMPSSAVASADIESGDSAEKDFAVKTQNANNADSFYTAYVMERFEESINECVALETGKDASGEIYEIYADEELVSYSVTTYPSNTVRFYNISRSDGRDILIEDILNDSEYSSSNCMFYVKEKNKIVVITDGEETEILLD